MEERDHLEAQYWWAFSCLVLAGRRSAADFHDELLRRTSCSFPTPDEVDKAVDEAVCYMGEVLNSGLAQNVPREVSLTGWKRHLLALASPPESREPDRKVLRFFSR
jgi:hypothetical protein